jgi:hypothetical protein
MTIHSRFAPRHENPEPISRNALASGLIFPRHKLRFLASGGCQSPDYSLAGLSGDSRPPLAEDQTVQRIVSVVRHQRITEPELEVLS